MPDLRSIEAIIFLLILFSGVIKWIVEKLIKLGRHLVERQRQLAEQANLEGSDPRFDRTEDRFEDDPDDEGEWETIDDWEQVDPEVFTPTPPSPRRDVVRPSTMSATELREYLQSIPAPGAQAEPAPSAPPPTPAYASAEEPEREHGDALVHTESTQAYRVSNDAYGVDVDAYELDTDAYDTGPRRARRHPLVGSLHRRRIQEGLIWREILSPPMSLRDQPPGHEAPQ